MFTNLYRLLRRTYPDVFQNAIHDGAKVIYSASKLFSEKKKQFEVTESQQPDSTLEEGARTRTLVVTLVSEINLEYGFYPICAPALAKLLSYRVLNQFVLGKHSHDSDILTSITVLNSVISMHVRE